MSNSLLDEAVAAGRRGEALAKEHWPNLQFPARGGAEDKAGVDAYLGYIDGYRAVQIKYDARMAETRNLYVEFYEKTKGSWGQGWRPSPHAAHYLLSICEEFGVLISLDALAPLLVRRQLAQINPTSIGVLLPLAVVEPVATEVKRLLAGAE